MSFKHFIITRFNLKHSSSNWQYDKSNKKVLTDDWLVGRMKVFMEYCLPSVVQQSNKNFSWLIYLDSDTDIEIKKHFQKLSNKFEFILPRYVNNYNQFLNNYCNDILDYTGDEFKNVITTRLDNDDIVHEDFILRIQESFKRQKYMPVNFLKILMLNPVIKSKIHIDYQFSNHFISLIEEVTEEGIKGCYHKGDIHWQNELEVIQITDKPYCIEIITDSNLSNNFRGFPYLKIAKLDKFQLLGGVYRNSYLDYDNLKLWKMSWIKYLKFLNER